MPLIELVALPQTTPVLQGKIESETNRLIRWWLNQRLKKLKGLSSKSMAVNPFLAPIIMGLHGLNDFDGLAGFLLGGHLSGGHNTGFGKLLDEKMLPQIFGTTKLTPKFRTANPIVSGSTFDEIDHLVPRADGTAALLSLKSSKWTIQLSMAVQLNHQFQRLVERRSEGLLDFSDIMIGVMYGTSDTLTDKYPIARGINTGADHHVQNLTEHVHVTAGREFWGWINYGEDQTQDWLAAAILTAVNKFQQDNPSVAEQTTAYRDAFVDQFNNRIGDDGSIDWANILRDING